MTVAYVPKASTFLAKKHATFAMGIFAGCNRQDRKFDGEISHKFVCWLKDSSGLPVDQKTGFSPITLDEETAQWLDLNVEQGDVVRIPIQISIFQGDSKGFLTVRHDSEMGMPQKATAKAAQ